MNIFYLDTFAKAKLPLRQILWNEIFANENSTNYGIVMYILNMYMYSRVRGRMCCILMCKYACIYSHISEPYGYH